MVFLRYRKGNNDGGGDDIFFALKKEISQIMIIKKFDDLGDSKIPKTCNEKKKSSRSFVVFCLLT